jgi:hypothetical protein
VPDSPSLAHLMVGELARLHGHAPNVHAVNDRLRALGLPLATQEEVARAVAALGVPPAPPPVERWGPAPGDPPGVDRRPRRRSA